MKKNPNFHTESRIQQDCVRWYHNSYCLIHHTPRCLILSIPNEGSPRLAQIGALAGASDLLVLHVATGRPIRLIFAEIKTPTGRQSPAQAKFEKHVKTIGVEYVIIRSLEEFKNYILNFE